MATYRVTAPDGRKIKLTGDSPPTEAELEQVFAGLAEKAPAQMATDQGMAGSEERAGEHGIGGAVLGAGKELGRGMLKPLDYIPIIAAARKLGVLPAGFDEAIAKTEKSLRPRGSTEQAGATTAKVVKGAGEVGAGLMAGGLPTLRLAREAIPVAEAAAPVAKAAAPAGEALKAGVEGAAEMLGQKIGGMSGLPGGRWLGGVLGRTISKRLATAAESDPAGIEKTLVETGLTKEAAKKAAQNIATRGAAEATPSAAKIAAAEASAAQMSRMTAEGAAAAKAAAPASYADPQNQILATLKGLATQGAAGKAKAKAITKEMFPESWQEMWKMIMAPRTTMPTINVPPPR